MLRANERKTEDVPARLRDRDPLVGERLLAYFGLGAEVAILPGGFALARQADHVAEVIRLSDLARHA
jgi:hypothetical protein